MAQKVSLVAAFTCLAVVITNVAIQLTLDWSWQAIASHPSVWLVALFGLGFAGSTALPRRVLEAAQVVLFLLMADVSTVLGGGPFALMVFFAVGTGLLYRYDFFPRYPKTRFLGPIGLFVPFLAYQTLSTDGMGALTFRTLNDLILMLASFTLIYLVFEQQQRQALASHSKQTAELEATRSELDRLEPLSALGENLSHVTHSFKNQLNHLVLARMLLDRGADRQEVSALLASLTETLDDRIENLLLVSRAGFDREPEVFDASRVLRGVEDVFVHIHPGSGPMVQHRPETGQVLLRAIRGDFILLAENLLKNAQEAIAVRPGAGTIVVELTASALTVANDGGAMDHCEGCPLSCGQCPHYGRPGQTTKPGGSGHGLAQIWAACRRAGWTWKVTAEGNWTRFEIFFRSAEPAEPVR